MDVEEMDDFPRRDFQVTAHAAAGLAARSSKIVNPDFTHRKAAEHDVAINGAAKLARLTNAIVITGRVRQILRLVLFPASAFQAHHFLQRDDISLKLSQDVSHARRAYASIDAAAFVRVV